jgi:hypothetical protein
LTRGHQDCGHRNRTRDQPDERETGGIGLAAAKSHSAEKGIECKRKESKRSKENGFEHILTQMLISAAFCIETTSLR